MRESSRSIMSANLTPKIGSNEYRGDGGKSRRDKREQEPDGKVIMKKLDIRL